MVANISQNSGRSGFYAVNGSIDICFTNCKQCNDKYTCEVCA